MDTIIDDMAKQIDSDAQWIMVNDGKEYPVAARHIICRGFHDAQRMAAIACALEASHMIYYGFEDNGFIGGSGVMGMYWDVVSCRVDELAVPSAWDAALWLTTWGLPAHWADKKHIKVFIGYARYRDREKISVAQVTKRQRA